MRTDRSLPNATAHLPASSSWWTSTPNVTAPPLQTVKPSLMKPIVQLSQMTLSKSQSPFPTKIFKRMPSNVIFIEQTNRQELVGNHLLHLKTLTKPIPRGTVEGTGENLTPSPPPHTHLLALPLCTPSDKRVDMVAMAACLHCPPHTPFPPLLQVMCFFGTDYVLMLLRYFLPDPTLLASRV